MIRIKFPEGSFKADNGIEILMLEVAIGERTEYSTELFVRGKMTWDRTKPTPFAGTIVVREGRNDVNDNLRVYWPDGTTDCPVDTLGEVISQAIDNHSDITLTEMNRICGD